MAAKDAEAVADRTEGRMKAGVELSVDELEQARAALGRQPALDAQRLAAFRTPDFAEGRRE